MYEYADEEQKNTYQKMPNRHFLSKEKNMDHAYLWNTFYRRNLHRFAIDYLGLNLHWYQIIILYFMGISQLIVIVASRAAAKSFIIAVYSCCRCITRPGSKIVLASATKGQAKLIVSEKIENELMSMSKMLKREIAYIRNSGNETEVVFKNHSKIKVCVASDNARGIRSNCVVREEFRMIDKNIDDSVLSPFQAVRQAPYINNIFYKDMVEVREEPVDIYISSSYYDNGHWMWKLVDDTFNDCLKGVKSKCVLAFDESVILKSGIKTPSQLAQEKKKQDPITWRMEFLNERVLENTSAFFTYKILTENQRLKHVFYPLSDMLIESKNGKIKNKYAIPKKEGEVRVVSCDMSFIEGTKNDNSVFTCIRALPEGITYHKDEDDESSEVELKQGYRREVSYIEAVNGGDTDRQALRIRQLYEDFEADYIVIDARNGGISVIYKLSKVMYDEDRRIEYQPLKCMNNETYANAIKNTNAKEAIYAVNATQQLNSDIAYSLLRALKEHRIDFLINYNDAISSLLVEMQDYSTGGIETQAFLEKPFLNTQRLISETAELVYEKGQQTGVIKIHEQGNNTKDFYTSCSYGNYFLDQLELDLLSDDSNKSSLEYFAKKQQGFCQNTRYTNNNTNKATYKKIFR